MLGDLPLRCGIENLEPRQRQGRYAFEPQCAGSAVDHAQVVIGPRCDIDAVFGNVESGAEAERHGVPAIRETVKINCRAGRRDFRS